MKFFDIHGLRVERKDSHFETMSHPVYFVLDGGETGKFATLGMCVGNRDGV